MDDSTRRHARLLVGLLLVTSPLYAPALSLTGDEYEYRSTRVVADENRLSIVNGSDFSLFYDGVDGLDCFYEYPVSRLCVHDAGLLNGTRNADHPNVISVTGSPPIHADERYVAFTNDSPTYQRTADWRNGHYVIGLERVSAAKALEDVAVHRDHVSQKVLTAIERESIRTDEPLADANSVVKTSDGYFVVYEQGRRSGLLDANPVQERLLEWIAVLFGAVLLYLE